MKRKYLLKKDPVDLRDHHFKSTMFKTAGQLPKSVDLRPFCPPVFDQGELGSCTANALVGLREFLLTKDKIFLQELSRLYVYWYERYLEGTVGSDEGASLRDGMKVLKNMGVCLEKDFPYDITKFTDKPSAIADVGARQFKIKEYHRVVSLTGMKVALAQGYTIVSGIEIYTGMESKETAATGIVPMPTDDDECLGGHAVHTVGYDDEKVLNGLTGYVLVENSWGDGWGEKGYFWLPYAYFKNYVLDMWTALA